MAGPPASFRFANRQRSRWKIPAGTPAEVPLSAPGPVHFKNCRAALHQLLVFLGDSAQSGGSRVVCHPLMVPLLSDYGCHLRDMAGVAASTCAYRVRYAREFLGTRLTKTGLRLGSIPAADLRRYIQSRGAALKPASLRVLAGALRDFLRFLHLTGRGGEHCAAAVPTPAPSHCGCARTSMSGHHGPLRARQSAGTQRGGSAVAGDLTP
jgi:hypothetical protein